MSTPAFTTSFAGLSLALPNASSHRTPRCSMGDSIAPKIVVVNTGNEQTSRLTLEWAAIPPKTGDATSVLANTALKIALRSISKVASSPAPVQPCPPSVTPKNFYFPPETRNMAPVISMTANESISVAVESINPSVANVKANSPDSVAFWKTPTYKYSAPDADEPVKPEVLSTELYEAYFPTKIRNLAPKISMRPPAGDWDKTAYLILDKEFVALNPDLARQLTVKPDDESGPAPSASATVEKFFGGEFMSKAPQISIDQDIPKVEFSLGDISPSAETVSAVFAEVGRPEGDQ
ncbi:unnamed protein product [Chondrus crispus]|uniref:Uncharacterized protein n=1 Tax=Chondrus crispus TaxID=2769 RepID=R7QI37_CHOCR|nr:unnamed protein product [Chondrus crispus]CDF37131.1 unnamed protein product [Chondrus crispus]|eukprot:XP_005716950.1 unnamed protein product [Chondrus crispus]